MGSMGEEPRHLVGSLDVELVGIELEALGIVDGVGRLHAQQNLVRAAVLIFDVVRIVGGDDRHTQLPRHFHQTRVDHVFFGHPVAHDFDIEPVAEDVDIGLGVFDRGLIVVFEQRRGHHARHTPREHDQAVVMLRQKIQVDARLVIVAFEKAFGYERGEVAVADQVGRQQRHVGLFAYRPVEAPARGDVGLAADDRGQAGVPGGVVELHRPVHHAVVGQGHGRSTSIGSFPAQAVDPAGPVEQRVLRMDVKMDELFQTGMCLT